ncbi:hypothetical protein [Streptomyces stelliscabiei]|uniref:dTDP-4-dehydrorhamnose 3,5-epimerase n=1 Tax=Streptomyces stelliscabiei TaxID=146820 RepID=A0A8I0NUP6_9ACTN|nr:hypothetical protein [Streptomyces stelliscabiei]MBE1593908.1 hypothetical protein [Streptomyces stelliscabiei]MDX2522281.1 hypothetical protein [Streptomyces stelliscabiei]
MLETADAGPRTALDRTTERRHIGTFQVPDDVTSMEFSLPGARLETTNVSESDGTNGVVRVTRISNGPGITDYVTHEKDFAYSAYGIHVGQDDRLTFFGEGQRITVHLIDCREDSPQLGDEITIEMAVSPYRVLIIPKGVAHTLDGLGGVVTRDEPVWYADQNPDWEPDNDLISFLRSSQQAPVVRTNRHELPVAAHLLLSRMSQQTNAQDQGAYAARYRVSIGGSTTYATLRPTWRAAETADDVHAWASRNNFVLTGPESFTVVPSTDSCTSDVLEVDLDGHPAGDGPDAGEGSAEAGEGSAVGRFVRHEYSRRRLTWLAGSTDAQIEVVTADGERSVIRLGDPTIGVRVPPGTWYRLTGTGRVWLRSEMELLDLEPWALDHPLGRDVTTADPSEAGASRPEQDSDRYLPGPALHALARMEAKAISLTR